MKISLWKTLGVSALAITALGCDSRPATRSGVNVDAGPVHVEKKPGQIDVNTGPGGVDVEVGRDPGRKPAVDVDVKPGGGVDVDVDGERIRERIQERREERQLENTTK